MKKRIGILEGKPIITGDKNLKTSNEIHISDLKGGGSGSENNNTEDKVIYYKVSDEFKSMSNAIFTEFGMLFSHLKFIIDGNVVFLTPIVVELVISQNKVDKILSKLDMVAFMPIDTGTIDFGGTAMKANSIEEWGSIIGMDMTPIIKQRVSKEEYYSL